MDKKLDLNLKNSPNLNSYEFLSQQSGASLIDYNPQNPEIEPSLIPKLINNSGTDHQYSMDVPDLGLSDISDLGQISDPIKVALFFGSCLLFYTAYSLKNQEYTDNKEGEKKSFNSSTTNYSHESEKNPPQIINESDNLSGTISKLKPSTNHQLQPNTGKSGDFFEFFDIFLKDVLIMGKSSFPLFHYLELSTILLITLIFNSLFYFFYYRGKVLNKGLGYPLFNGLNFKLIPVIIVFLALNLLYVGSYFYINVPNFFGGETTFFSSPSLEYDPKSYEKMVESNVIQEKTWLQHVLWALSLSYKVFFTFLLF